MKAIWNVDMKREMIAGDIFMIPLFLPSYQEWRNLDELMNYWRYQFHPEDVFAFGRLIELEAGNMNLVEIFSYVGRIPESPEVIVRSGQLFAPVMVVGVFSRGRWRFLFDDPGYDKWADSDYENVSFLLYSELWKGGEKISISQQERKNLKESGVCDMVVYGGVGLEVKIRSLLAKQGMDLNYEQIVEERKNEYPKPRDLDKKLRETIAPFRWLSEHGKYSLSLDAGLLNQDSFTKYGMLGNGYDWEKAALVFAETHEWKAKGKFSFDCEADTFSMQSTSKKRLKEFALAFHKCVLDTEEFEELLKWLNGLK